jgi:hypothetical protein
MRILWLIGLVSLHGCLVSCVNPGSQTATGLKQTGDLNYTTEVLKYQWEGSQENKAIFAEGHVVMNEDGTVNWAESALTAYVQLEPSAEQAAGTMAALAQVLQAQSQMVAEQGRLLTGLVASLVPNLSDESPRVDEEPIPVPP